MLGQWAGSFYSYPREPSGDGHDVSPEPQRYLREGHPATSYRDGSSEKGGGKEREDGEGGQGVGGGGGRWEGRGGGEGGKMGRGEGERVFRQADKYNTCTVPL